MKTSRKENALLALQEAVRLRRSLGYKLWDAIPVYDCAEKLGIEVRFIDVPSLEAIYVKGSPPIILISSLRPTGRQGFNCAHEIGHHVFNHGNRIDEEITFANSKLDPEEFLAQAFAGYFLMPKAAVEAAFVRHGVELHSCTPTDVYVISNWFGVGYDTLIDHLRYSLHVISVEEAESLKTTRPRQIRESLVGQVSGANLTVVTPHWYGRAIDIQVSDIILLPKGTSNKGSNITLLERCETGDLFQGVKPGISQVQNPSGGWSAFVRVSKRGFVGRSIFRHLDDPEYDQNELSSNQQ